MASFIKHTKGWRAQVARQGIRRSKVFPTKREAMDWAARQEHLITQGDKIAAAMTFGEVMERYALEVSPGKRGHHWEVIRLRKLCRDPIASISLRDLGASDFAKWRDKRLREVAPASVAREMNLIGSVLTTARKEWELIPDNPLSDVRKPTEPPPRDRLPTADEMERMQFVAGDNLSKVTARAYHAFRFGCETAMRAGEIVGLHWADIKGSVAHLPLTKNGLARKVPLSSAALALLDQLPRCEQVFNLDSRQVDSLFRKVRKKAGIEDLVFHDSRAYAATMLAKKVDVLTLAKITGHRDLSLLMNTYYRESADDIAVMLD